MASSKERMQNTEAITSQRRAMKKLPCLIAVQPPLHHTSPLAPAQLSAHFLPPVLPLVPMTSLSVHPVPASVTSYSDQTGPLPTTCPDCLPPPTSFAPSHLPSWVTSTLACPPALLLTLLLPQPAQALGPDKLPLLLLGHLPQPVLTRPDDSHPPSWGLVSLPVGHLAHPRTPENVICSILVTWWTWRVLDGDQLAYNLEGHLPQVRVSFSRWGSQLLPCPCYLAA